MVISLPKNNINIREFVSLLRKDILETYSYPRFNVMITSRRNYVNLKDLLISVGIPSELFQSVQGDAWVLIIEDIINNASDE